MTPKGQTRSERVPVLLTPDERDKLQAAADRAGMALSTFIRVKALEAVNAARGGLAR